MGIEKEGIGKEGDDGMGVGDGLENWSLGKIMDILWFICQTVHAKTEKEG